MNGGPPPGLARIFDGKVIVLTGPCSRRAFAIQTPLFKLGLAVGATEIPASSGVYNRHEPGRVFPADGCLRKIRVAGRFEER